MTHLPLLRLRCATTTGLTDAQTAGHAGLLDARERKTYQRFSASEDRRDYAAAHALLRRTLTAAAPSHPPEAWCFARTALGKPYLSGPDIDDPPLCFNLSHTRGLVACVVSRDGEVGVDAECRSHIKDLERLMAGVCSADEYAQVRAAPAPEQLPGFLDLWSLKEAYVKACGTGIDTTLAHISFDLRSPSLIRASLPAGAAPGWCFALFRPVVDSRIAIAMAPAWGSKVRLDAARVGSSAQSAPMAPIRASDLFAPVA